MRLLALLICAHRVLAFSDHLTSAFIHEGSPSTFVHEESHSAQLNDIAEPSRVEPSSPELLESEESTQTAKRKVYRWLSKTGWFRVNGKSLLYGNKRCYAQDIHGKHVRIQGQKAMTNTQG